MEGLWRRSRLSGRDTRNGYLGRWSIGPNEAVDGVWNRACGADSTVDRGQAVRHRRSHRREPVWLERRLRLERGRIRDVWRDAARSPSALRVRTRMAPCDQARMVA